MIALCAHVSGWRNFLVGAHKEAGRLRACGVSLCLFTAPLWANNPPLTPEITEPPYDGYVSSPADVHMESTPFIHPDLGAEHLCTDWEIWDAPSTERVWSALCVTGFERVHAHLGDGSFENSHADRSKLLFDTDYLLRVRYRDDSGDPATEWSDWAYRAFRTGPQTSIFPLTIRHVFETPTPAWISAAGGEPILLPAGDTPPSLRLEGPQGDLLLAFTGQDGLTNMVLTPPELDEHVSARVAVFAGDAPGGLILPASDLTFTRDGTQAQTVYLPPVNLAADETVLFWVSIDGSTYAADPGSTEPDFSTLVRGSPVPWVVRQPGFAVEVVATGFQLPVNIAFVPSPGDAPDDPFYYVTELYGTIKVVARNGVVNDYATNLLNYTPNPAFPGQGEQGLAGIVVDPATGDVYASMLHFFNGTTHPRVVRLSSNDGGRTAATQTVVLDMPGETQGQSHQISNLSIGPDGRLYVHMGDGFQVWTARNLNSFRGKILRMNLDGSPAEDNPFYDASDGNSAKNYVYAYGLRNPFGGAWRAADGSLYQVENGPAIDRFARVIQGADYGWNGSDFSMTTLALYVWNPAPAPVNIAFIQPETFGGSGFPTCKGDRAYVSLSGPTYATGPQHRGKRIDEFVLDENGELLRPPFTLVEYTGSGKATAVALAAGPDGLYFSDFYKDLNYDSPIDPGANILRIRFLGDPFDETDCNNNGIPDACDLADGTSTDCGSGVPDECEPCPCPPAGSFLDDDGCPILPHPDFDGDGDVDMKDFAHIQRCLHGPFDPLPHPSCETARLALDAHVGHMDMLIFTECLSGANVPAAPDCTGPVPP